MYLLYPINPYLKGKRCPFAHPHIQKIHVLGIITLQCCSTWIQVGFLVASFQSSIFGSQRCTSNNQLRPLHRNRSILLVQEDLKVLVRCVRVHGDVQWYMYIHDIYKIKCKEIQNWKCDTSIINTCHMSDVYIETYKQSSRDILELFNKSLIICPTICFYRHNFFQSHVFFKSLTTYIHTVIISWYSCCPLNLDLLREPHTFLGSSAKKNSEQNMATNQI